jgi:hypothetical protein
VREKLKNKKNQKKTTDNSLTGPGGGPGDMGSFHPYTQGSTHEKKVDLHNFSQIRRNFSLTG